MGFQNENQLKVGASVKATINDKVVEAKVIGIGFNRVTLRSEKGNEVSYAFNSEKFLRWFNQVPLNEVAKNHAESGKKDILEGLKIVTSGPTIKERTTTPKEKESRYKLDFDFYGEKKDEKISAFLSEASLYANTEREGRLSVLFALTVSDGQGFQSSMIIVHALTCAQKLNKHSDAEWLQMIKSRNVDECYWDSFDDMDREDIRSFCNLIVAYANDEKREIILDDLFSKVLPKDEKEAMFVAQLLCDGGINKYDLTCTGLTENLLKDNRWSYGMRDEDYDDEGNVIAERELVSNNEVEYPPHVGWLSFLISLLFSYFSFFVLPPICPFNLVALILKPYLCMLFRIQKAFFFKFLVFFDRIIHKGLDRNPASRDKIPIHFQILWL